jgi:hypothetical protein
MPTRMPLQVPTRTDDNIGRIKSDFDPPPDLTHHIPASEWNQFQDEFIAACQALVNLGMAGATGTLQNAYNNSVVSPTPIQLAAAQGRILVKDTAAGLGTTLLAVSKSDGTAEHGFTRNGVKLNDHPDALHTAAGVPWQARSYETTVHGVAYFFDTQEAFGANTHTRWTVQQNAILALLAGNGAGQPTELQAWNGAGTMLGRLLFEVGKTRLAGLASGVDFVPRAAGDGNLGTPAEPWESAHAYYFRGRSFTVAYNAALVVDASLGELATVTLTDNVATLSIGNFGAGQRLAIKFIQDGVGGRTMAPLGVIPAIKLTRDVPFTLSPAGGAEDILYLYSDGTNYYEVARKQARPPEYRFQFFNLGGGGTLDITPHVSAHHWTFSDTLNAAVVINLSRTNAKEGDRIHLEFEEATGVVTSVVNTLTIQENGGGALKVYNQAKTLRGQVSAIYTGTSWRLNIGGCLSYT